MAMAVAAVALDSATGSSYQVARNTDSARTPGRNRQISSAVKDMIGASQRAMASAICHSTVCAERRGSEFTGVV